MWMLFQQDEVTSVCNQRHGMQAATCMVCHAVHEVRVEHYTGFMQESCRGGGAHLGECPNDM